MTEDEYWQSDPGSIPELLSTFLSEEDIATETNVIIIPSLKIDLDLQLDNYVALMSKAKTKQELKLYLQQIWNHAMTHGSIMERIDKLQTDVEMLQYDLGDIDYEIEFIDDNEDCV